VALGPGIRIRPSASAQKVARRQFASATYGPQPGNHYAYAIQSGFRRAPVQPEFGANQVQRRSRECLFLVHQPTG